LQFDGVAVEVNFQGVAALEPFGAVGVEHGHEVHRQLSENGLPHRIQFVGSLQEVEHVEHGHRSRRFVAVHLRPQQYLAGPLPAVTR
jgi:hypothetical protein